MSEDGKVIRFVLTNNQSGLIRLDREHRIVEIDDVACELLDQSRDALLKRSLFAFIGREQLPALGDRNAAVATTNLTLTNGNRHIPCQVIYQVILDQYQQPDGSYLLLKSLAEQLDQGTYLRQAAAVFAHAAEGIVILNGNGRVELVNPAFTTITGFTKDEVIGRTPQFFRYGHIWAELLATGHWQGEIVNTRKSGESYPQWLSLSAVYGADGTAQSYIGLFSDVSRLKKSEDELKHMAHYDALTDLPNRTLLSIQLNMALERAARRSNKLAVFGVDLDGFKTVNDSLGHPAGDLLLQKIAARLRMTLRSEDVVARMGGDEFAMIIENPPSAVHIGHLAEKLIAAVDKPVDLQGSKAHVTASVGIAIYPQDGHDATSLLKAADTAMYASKQAGKNTYRYHDEEMARAADQRMALEQGLRQAQELHQLELCYLPQLDIQSGRVLGVEALVRWHHPELGTIDAVEFATVAEETGLIVSVGEWALRAACGQIQAWTREGLFSGSVSVKVAGLQIERNDFYASVNRALEETGVEPGRLVIEVNEHTLLRNTAHVLAELDRLRNLGVGIVIDDFSIGHASLAYLKNLRVRGIKIHQRFVLGLPADKNNAAITRAIIAMGHSLGFDLIAEGIETKEQEIFLEEEGCAQAQGRLYSKPIPRGEFESWLQARLTAVADARNALADASNGARQP
ncbi:putative bifunctional diguanylate cyclase/phosphodiesterase [Parasulfuritortus cantonensis]|uniref:putative bifunctional diguanylate cyclase/phosphodiesterase n=1 Tax=Parasulfuritortus cantonensis TaxID=2528202 RepID=UPI001404C5CE|nr:bifunctional diguanylate cyclase/phosphodiesterase [Parasulfuritortus cantonensis]